MTQTSDSEEDKNLAEINDILEITNTTYPTEWHMIDDVHKMECRELVDGMYQIKSPIAMITINEEGFELFKDGSPQGVIIWYDWLKRHGIVAIPLDQVND